eukprot:9429753-Alexandrium_andersonii.AAC.1
MGKRPRKPSAPQGGYRQALARASHASESSAPSQRDALAKLLIQDWSWGGMSAHRIQQIAHAAYEDGLRTHTIERLAKLGTSGDNPQNCHRDLEAM